MLDVGVVLVWLESIQTHWKFIGLLSGVEVFTVTVEEASIGLAELGNVGDVVVVIFVHEPVPFRLYWIWAETKSGVPAPFVHLKVTAQATFNWL